jgi:hypothetical protein
MGKRTIETKGGKLRLDVSSSIVVVVVVIIIIIIIITKDTFFCLNPILFASCTDTFSKWCKITRGMKKSA